jgi:hut operon positive regulatory protein
MDIKIDRLGKAALMAALTSQEEETVMKANFASMFPGNRLAITFVSGLTSEVRKKIVQSVIACALQNGIIVKVENSVHAVMHAALEAFEHIESHIPVDASLKMKVAIVTDDRWVAVAIYGDSAIQVVTNHERAGFGMMHL